MGVLETLGLHITVAGVEDMPFVWNSWLLSSADSDAGRLVRRSQFIAEQKRRIEGVLPTASIIVARSVYDPLWIGGWLCRTGDHLHYTFVKSSHRGIGLGRALLSASGPLTTYGFRRPPWTDALDRMGLQFTGEDMT
jgi:GNAT superfamily N-acetyltransferase